MLSQALLQQFQHSPAKLGVLLFRRLAKTAPFYGLTPTTAMIPVRPIEAFSFIFPFGLVFGAFPRKQKLRLFSARRTRHQLIRLCNIRCDVHPHCWHAHLDSSLIMFYHRFFQSPFESFA
jgi:hypothetical protein